MGRRDWSRKFDTSRDVLTGVIPMMLAIILAAVTCYWIVEPGRIHNDDPVNVDFSTKRALVDLRALAARPRATGSIANQKSRDYLVKRLSDLGFIVRLDPFPLPKAKAALLTERGGPAASTGINIVALRPGKKPEEKAVALMAHYDSVWGSPGAADDAFGVSSALEVARAIPVSAQRRDFVILFTDAEEIGLAGARHFFAPVPAGDALAGRIGIAVNLEARGGGGRALMFQTSAGNKELVELYRSHVAEPATNSLAVSVYQRLPNSTDLTAALDRGILGYNIAPIGNPALYHSPLATADAIDPRTLQHMGDQTLDIVRALLTAKELPKADGDVIFSDIFGKTTLSYPAAAGWAVIFVPGLMMGVAAFCRKSSWSVPSVAFGALEGLTAAIIGAVMMQLMHLLSFGSGPADYYDRLASLPYLELQDIFVILMIFVGLCARRPRHRYARVLGFQVVLLAAACVAQIVLPGATPPITWPLVLSSLVVLCNATLFRSSYPLAVMANVVVAVIGLAFIGCFAHFGILAVGASIPAVIAPLLLPALALVGSLIAPIPRAAALVSFGLLLSVALATVTLVRFDSRAPSVPVYLEYR